MFAASGGAVSSDKTYIEDVFSTYLYTGNGSTQNINNGIALGSTDSWSVYSTSGSMAAYGSPIAVDSTGSFYVIKSYSSNAYLVKYSALGTIEWQKQFAGGTEVYTTVVDSSDNVYATFIDEASNRTPHIIKFDSSGTLQWKKKNPAISSYGSRMYGLAVDSSGNVYASGNAWQADAVILGTQVKLTSSGATSWIRSFKATSGTYPHAMMNRVTTDSSGNSYFAGSIGGGSDGGGFTAKYNSAGTLQWARKWTHTGLTSYFTAIAVDSSGNVYVGGQTGTSPGNIALILKYDSSGTLQWVKKNSLTGTSSVDYNINSIKIHSSGDLILGCDGGYIIRMATDGTVVSQCAVNPTISSYSGVDVDNNYMYYNDYSASTNSVVRIPVSSTIISGQAGPITIVPGFASFSDASSLGTSGSVSYTETSSITMADSTITISDSALTSTSYTQAAVSGSGGMVWIKDRTAAQDHNVFDTVRGRYGIETTKTNAQFPLSPVGKDISSFNATGFSLGAGGYSATNIASDNFVSWTFRKAPKFFDVVTWTGDDTSGRSIGHSLGQTPGMVIIKLTSAAGSNWMVWHRGSGTPYFLHLNLTDASYTSTYNANLACMTQAPDATNIYIKNTSYDSIATNGLGYTYVAYLFAHDTTTDGMIQCGTFTGNTTVNLGWEPQYILLKATNAVEGWHIHDNMRSWPVSGDAQRLYANSSAAEDATSQIYPNATGFSTLIGTNTYIYMAIRRGPMRVPTDGTKVFKPTIGAGGAYGQVTNFPVDMGIVVANRSSPTPLVCSRLQGKARGFYSPMTNAEFNETDIVFDSNTGYMTGSYSGGNGYTNNISWAFRRAPGFFDVVCYTGDGASSKQIYHNLGVAPEMVIIKRRNSTSNWPVFHKDLNPNYMGLLNTTGACNYDPGATQNLNKTYFLGFGAGLADANNYTNTAGATYVAHLFASCPGVSKVGSYTGNGTSQTINCGFTNGARFVLIKRTDSTGDWIVYDTARGIVAGVDPSLALNTTTAETSSDGIDPDPTGFIVNVDTYVASKNPNVNAATYIYLAIA